MEELYIEIAKVGFWSQRCAVFNVLNMQKLLVPPRTGAGIIFFWIPPAEYL